jgi:hypothetical protein
LAIYSRLAFRSLYPLLSVVRNRSKQIDLSNATPISFADCGCKLSGMHGSTLI